MELSLAHTFLQVLWLPTRPDAYPCDKLSSFLETRASSLPDLRSLDISLLSDAEVIKAFNQLCCSPQQALGFQQQPVSGLRSQLRDMQSWYRLCPDTPLGHPLILPNHTISVINVLWRSLSCSTQYCVPDFRGLDGLFVLHIKRNLLASFWMKQDNNNDDLLRHLPILFGLPPALPARARTTVQEPSRNPRSGSHCAQSGSSLSKAIRSVTESAGLQESRPSLARSSPARITAADLNNQGNPHSQSRAPSVISASASWLSPPSCPPSGSSAEVQHSAPQSLARNARGFSIKGASQSRPSEPAHAIPSHVSGRIPKKAISISSSCSSTAARRAGSQCTPPQNPAPQLQTGPASSIPLHSDTTVPPSPKQPPCAPSSSSQSREPAKALFQDPDATSLDSANHTKDTSLPSPLSLRHHQDAQQFMETVFGQLGTSNASSTNQTR